LSDQSECYERAAKAEERADAINDPALKAEFPKTEMRWLTCPQLWIQQKP
jgi:glutaredoxin-related protein